MKDRNYYLQKMLIQSGGDERYSRWDAKIPASVSRTIEKFPHEELFMAQLVPELWKK